MTKPKLYPKSQVDEIIDKILKNNNKVHLQQEVFYNKKIDELKAKLKEIYIECEDLIYAYTQEKHIRFKNKWEGKE